MQGDSQGLSNRPVISAAMLTAGVEVFCATVSEDRLVLPREDIVGMIYLAMLKAADSPRHRKEKRLEAA